MLHLHGISSKISREGCGLSRPSQQFCREFNHLSDLPSRVCSKNRGCSGAAFVAGSLEPHDESIVPYDYGKFIVIIVTAKVAAIVG